MIDWIRRRWAALWGGLFGSRRRIRHPERHPERPHAADPHPFRPPPKEVDPWSEPPAPSDVAGAARSYAPTLRTGSRERRDQGIDEARLARLGLPVWRHEADIAYALGISVGTLRHFSIHRNRERVPHYVTFAVPKRSGGERLICAPKQRLKAIQRTLLRELVGKLPVHDAAHGFRRGRSVATCAAPHVGQAVVIRMDLVDFFGTVTFPRVRGLLLALGYGHEAASVLAVLVTEAPRQPVDVDGELFHVPVGPRHCVQGAPTSPGLCNAIVHKLDRRLTGLAAHLGLNYTRYADDLTWSGPDVGAAGRLVTAVGRIVEAEGFAVNHDKTRVMRRGRRQAVCGVTVNETLGLSRTQRRRLRAMIHAEEQRREGGGGDPAQAAMIDGWLAYLSMLNPEQAATLRARWSGG